MKIFWRNKKIIASGAIALFLFLYHVIGITKPVDIVKRPIIKTVERFYSVGIGMQNLWFGITKGKDISEELSDLKSSCANFGYLESQKTQTIEFPKITGAKVVQAKVVMMPFFEEKKTILIDKGYEDGIFEEASVITKEGVYVGKIIKTQKKSSTILLATDSSSATAVTTSEETEYHAIAKGRDGLSMEMDLIPQDTKIKKGDLIVTSLLEEGSPRGLLVGIVTNVKYTEGQLFKKADVSPFVSLSSLKDVGIILPEF